MSMTVEARNRAIGMWGLAICMLCIAAGWMFMRFGISWSVADLPESDNVVRLIPAYIISEVAVIPLGAKLADRWGVKRVLLVGPIIFILGSILSIVSVNVEMLIAFRFLQGIGGGIVLGLGFTAVGRYYGPDERGKCHELMTAAFAIGSLFASAAGYFLTDNFNWRAGFILLAVLMLIGTLMAWRLLPEDNGSETPLDKINLLLVTILFGLAAYYTQSVDVDYNLLSIPSYVMIAAIIAVLIITLWHSKRSENPAIPVGISSFEKKLIVLMFLFSVCGLGLIQYYFKLYLTYFNFDIYEASFNFVLLILGAGIPSLLGCRMVTKTGVKPWVTTGAIFVAIALVITHFFASESEFWFGFSLFMFGFGLGMIVTEIIISLQRVIPKKDMGQHTGNLMAVRMIGIIAGNAVVGSYINSVIRENYVPGIIDISTADQVLTEIAKHMSDNITYMADSLNDGFMFVVLIMAAISVILAVVAYSLKKYDLENRSEE
ncbi:MAG: MFS transporter [Thermoplasmata archaeon]|nr:MFS transporter [Thermoplasmata archaeon]